MCWDFCENICFYFIWVNVWAWSWLSLKCAFTFIWDCQPLPKLAITFCVLTNNVWEFQLLCLLVSTWYCQVFFLFWVILIGVQRYPAVVLICFSLMLMTYPCNVLYHGPIENMTYVHILKKIGLKGKMQHIMYYDLCVNKYICT